MNTVLHIRAMGDTASLCGDTDGRWTHAHAFGTCVDCALARITQEVKP